jgi:copper homeostasis protein
MRERLKRVVLKTTVRETVPGVRIPLPPPSLSSRGKSTACILTSQNMPNRVTVEICVHSIESAVAADRGGADRIELCSSLAEGGVTPNAGLIATVLSKVSLAVFVMIRPRGGDFCYSDDEFRAMQQDVATAKQLGADGVVFGFLNEDGRVDAARTHQLVELARPLNVTFHRAFDVARDLNEALEELVRGGVDRVLTSGGEQSADLGRIKIAELNLAAKDRIIVMAGAGITEQNVHDLLAETGVREIHASLRTAVPSPMRYRNEKISFGGGDSREHERFIVFEERVRALREAASEIVRD